MGAGLVEETGVEIEQYLKEAPKVITGLRSGRFQSACGESTLASLVRPVASEILRQFAAARALTRCSRLAGMVQASSCINTQSRVTIQFSRFFSATGFLKARKHHQKKKRFLPTPGDSLPPTYPLSHAQCELKKKNKNKKLGTLACPSLIPPLNFNTLLKSSRKRRVA